MLELLEQVPDLEAIIVPIGGGGLISGIATAAKAINPSIIIVGERTIWLLTTNSNDNIIYWRIHVQSYSRAY